MGSDDGYITVEGGEEDEIVVFNKRGCRCGNVSCGSTGIAICVILLFAIAIFIGVVVLDVKIVGTDPSDMVHHVDKKFDGELEEAKRELLYTMRAYCLQFTSVYSLKTGVDITDACDISGLPVINESQVDFTSIITPSTSADSPSSDHSFSF